MQSSDITYEAVAQAAESLLLEGEKITMIKLRKKLNDHPDKTKISEFYKEWKTKAMQSSSHSAQSTQSTAATTSSSIQPSAHDNDDIYAAMSSEWETILNEKDSEIKVKKLYAALLKEQSRRESAEHMAKDAKLYAEVVKEQVTHRINEIRQSSDDKVAFLEAQLKQLKQDMHEDLLYYREKLEQANKKLISPNSVKSDKKD